MLISLFSLRRKDMEMCYFRITEISENPPKNHLFVYFRIFSLCEKKGFCAVIYGAIYWNKLSNDLKILNTATSFTHYSKKLVLKKLE